MKQILDHLAAAYGGHSQYSTADIGHAIRGHIRNQGWSPERAAEYAAQVAALLAERWEGQGNTPNEDAAEILAAITE